MLTRAEVDLDLGAALCRAGYRRNARVPLRRSLDTAARCGATRIARHGAKSCRPRAPARAVSASPVATRSRRAYAGIAEIAAGGLTNREISEHLFLTPKTVENQLGRIYVKLGISSRREIATALAA